MYISDIVAMVIRETFTRNQIPRIPEPTAAMENTENVDAFSDAGRTGGLLSPTYLCAVARGSQALQGSQRVIDLGCGPARILIQMAKVNPEISFLGIELSDGMLRLAAENIKRENINNIDLRKADFTELSFLKDKEVDGVMSTLTLHHLPSKTHLNKCFLEIRRVLKDDGALFLYDLARPKTEKTILQLAYDQTAANGAPEFGLDSERSWRAAYLPSDFSSVANAVFADRQIEVHATWLVPVMMMLKTKDRVLPNQKIEHLRELRKNLIQKHRTELDQLRYFFKLNGLGNDPFA